MMQPIGRNRFLCRKWDDVEGRAMRGRSIVVRSSGSAALYCGTMTSFYNEKRAHMTLHTSRHLITIAATLSAICGSVKTTAIASGAPTRQSSLQIVILEGDGVINVISKNQVRSRRIVLRVDDDAGKPVSGATVSFQMPDANEPGGTMGGQTAASVITGVSGLARITFQPNHLPGTFDVDVNASSQGRSASTFVTETNLQYPAHSIGHDKLWRFLGLGAAALTVAIILANPSRSTPNAPPVRGRGF